MKRTAAEIAKSAGRFLGNHLTELFNPETPSYKTSMTAAVLFGLISLFTGEKQFLFWLAFICCLFFAVLSAKQYGLSNLLKRSPAATKE